ncbi:BTB/POZ domain-containing protein 1-like [Mercenaria mercenaria]|uniref:BTB/POZ domain-containing protein 1-like n=1 Tax=Mercenaria mercenaria TaxID=6596 RepID=UPI00234EF551|nr:BTB/POZ domain-containing protein 1-like [Mercenaria mercenaria]
MEENSTRPIQRVIQQPTCVDWQQGKSIGESLLEMFDRCLWTDVKLHCKGHQEGEAIKAHKIVLATRSPVFQAMFFGPCADGKNEVDLENAEEEIFNLFLRYLYSDRVTLTEEHAFAVMDMAHYYKVSSLVLYCADYLTTIITPSNACEILSTAMLYELTGLKNVCCSFIDSHAQQVLKSNGFLNLSENCLLYLLKGDTFFAKEEEILEAADKWSRKRVLERGLEENGTNIRQCLGQIFYHLRLPTMTHKSLIDNISRKGYFSVEEYSDIAGYINNIPGISVSTNSCVTRLPEVETIQVSIESEWEEISDSISISFEITVSKDVALANIILSKMRPHFKDLENLYSQTDCSPEVVLGEKAKIFLEEYENKVMEIKSERSERNYAKTKYFISVLEHYKQNLCDDLGLVLTVSVVIDSIEFKHKFNVKQNKLEEGRVDFNPPLILKERSTPYLVEINIQYSCEHRVQIKTRIPERSKVLINHIHGVKLESTNFSTNYWDTKSSFTGIKSLGFLNFSNRDISKDTTNGMENLNIPVQSN